MGSEVSSGGHNNDTTMELELSTMEQFETKRSPKSDPNTGEKLEVMGGPGTGYSSGDSRRNMKPSRGAFFSEEFFCPLEGVNPGQHDPVDWKVKTGVEIELETSTGDPAGLKLSEGQPPQQELQEDGGNVGEGACSEPEPAFTGEVETEAPEGRDQDEYIMPDSSRDSDEGEKNNAGLMEGAVPNVEVTGSDADDEDEAMQMEETATSPPNATPLPTPTDPVDTITFGLVAEMGTNTSQPIFQNANVGTSQVLVIDSETGMSQPFTVDNGVQTSQGLLDDLLSTIAKKSNRVGGKMKMNSNPNAGVATTSTATTSNVLSRTILRQSTTNTKPNQASPAKRPRLSNLDGNRNKHSIYSTDVTFDFDDASKERLGDVGFERSYKEYASNLENLSVNDDLENQENEPVDSAYSSFTMCSGSAVCGSSRRVGLPKRSRKPLHSVFLRPQTYSNENE